MTDEVREYESAVEARLTAEFGCSEPDAERVAAAAGRLRREEEADWNPSFLVEKLTDAPKDASVPEKWKWWLSYYGRYTTDLSAYEISEPSGGASATSQSPDDDSADESSADGSATDDSSTDE